MTKAKSLYRDSSHGRIAGVCAGIADYFGIETWLVRILTVTAFFLLGGPFVLVAYVACWFILDKKPENEGMTDDLGRRASSSSFGKGWKNTHYEAKEQKVEVKTKVWQAGETPTQALHDIAKRFQQGELRLRKIETYVTSREFQLNREINQL
jgi:phage shock protein C